MAASFGKIPTTSVRRLISAFEPLERIGRRDLLAMRFGEVHEREHVVLGLVHHRGELGQLRAELVRDNDVPLLAGAAGVLAQTPC